MPNEAVSAELVLRDQPVSVVLTNRQLQFIANTEFVPKSYRGNLPAMLACIATGRALGIPDMSALQEIAIIDGKPSKSSALCQLLVRKHGHSIRVELSEDATRADAYGKRADTGDPGSAYFTLDMAKRANLLGKKNWQQYPEAMLKARAITQLCRDLFSDCLAGASYTQEELGSEDWIADEVIDDDAEQRVPFDSGPLPDNEDQAVQLGFGGLTEPVTDATENDLGGDAAQVGTGSVSSWADLKTAGASIGLTPDELRGRAKIEFMGRSAADVTAEEWNAFWVSLRDSVKVEA